MLPLKRLLIFLMRENPEGFGLSRQGIRLGNPMTSSTAAWHPSRYCHPPYGETRAVCLDLGGHTGPPLHTRGRAIHYIRSQAPAWERGNISCSAAFSGARSFHSELSFDEMLSSRSAFCKRAFRVPFFERFVTTIVLHFLHQ
jgi:hypothetical protein